MSIASHREHTSKALRYGTHSQRISQFYPLNGMNHTCQFAFPAEAGTHLPTPEGLKAELALGGWLENKVAVFLPRHYNTLPTWLRQAGSRATFCSKLKTHFFNLSYNA